MVALANLDNRYQIDLGQYIHDDPLQFLASMCDPHIWHIHIPVDTVQAFLPSYECYCYRNLKYSHFYTWIYSKRSNQHIMP